MFTRAERYTLDEIEAELGRRQAAELFAIDAELAERSLREYIKQAWEQVEPGRHLLWNWHIDVIADHLEAAYRLQIKKLLINIPPRFAKSLLVCVFFMSWVWILNATRRFMFASYSNLFSKRDSLRSRKLIQSDWYQARWGDRFQLSGDQNEKMKFDNDKTGFRLATSVGGTATGEGGDILVVDDAHKPDEVYSDTVRESVLTWWRETWSSRVIDESTSVKIVIGQRLHKQDLPGYLLHEEGGWEPVILPLEANPKKYWTTSIAPNGYDPRTEVGELLFEKRISRAQLPEIKRRSGTLGYAGQYNQEPISMEGNLFKRRWWRFWRPDGLNAIGQASRPEGCLSRDVSPARVLPTLDRYLISLDANFKEGKKNSWVVFGVWGVSGADKYLLARKRENIGFTATLATFRTLSEEWPLALEKLVEDKANGPAIINTLQHEIPGIIPIEPKGSKEARAAACSPEVESGNVYLPEGADWLEEYVAELAAFPLGDHDDQVDMTSQVLLHLGASPDLSRFLGMVNM
jgi:predicted phage terminase large subunit-like protein